MIKQNQLKESFLKKNSENIKNRKSLKRSLRQLSQSSIPSPKIQETQLYDKVTKVQEQIYSIILETKLLKKNFSCEHTSLQICDEQKNIQDDQNDNKNTEQLKQPYDPTVNYYDKFWKQFLLNEMTKYKVMEMMDTMKKINKAQHTVQHLFQTRQQLYNNASFSVVKKERKRAHRGKSVKFILNQNPQQKAKQCPFNDCFRQYGSGVSLNLHMKLKHNAGNKSQRQKLAGEIWNMEAKAEKSPLNITFPPGYLEEYGMLIGKISLQDYESQKAANKWIDGQVDRQRINIKHQVQPISGVQQRAQATKIQFQEQQLIEDENVKAINN